MRSSPTLARFFGRGSRPDALPLTNACWRLADDVLAVLNSDLTRPAMLRPTVKRVPAFGTRGLTACPLDFNNFCGL